MNLSGGNKLKINRIDINRANMESIFFLTLGVFFLFFSNGRYFFAPAAWIAPIFLLLYTKKQKLVTGYIVNSFMIGLATMLSFWKFSSNNPKDLLFYIPFLLGFLFAIPYLLDRLISDNLKGILKTLIFPLSYVTIEFMYVNLSPFGSTGSIAYTQMNFLQLIQIVSITGIYGVTFMVTWFSSVIKYTVMEQKTIAIKKCLYLYGLIFILVMCFGGVRLLLTESDKTVQVSGISVYDLRSSDVINKIRNVRNDTKSFRQLSDEILYKLIDVTKQEALSGSKIVIWSELSPLEFYDNEIVYRKIISEAAKETGIYIVTSPYIISKELNGKSTNKLEIYNPNGEIVLEHIKYGGAMFDNIIEGDNKLKSVNTQYGNFGGVICWDTDFPDIMRQTGKLKIDILFSPAADWKEITPLHSTNAYFRGIENGMSVIRQTTNGLSFASDYKGRILTQMNYYTSSDKIIRAQIPIKGCFTLYPYISDCFAYICIFFLALFFYKTYFSKKTKKVYRRSK